MKIVILGGTGFVGRHLVARLAALGHDVAVLSRNPDTHRCGCCRRASRCTAATSMTVGHWRSAWREPMSRSTWWASSTNAAIQGAASNARMSG